LWLTKYARALRASAHLPLVRSGVSFEIAGRGLVRVSIARLMIMKGLETVMATPNNRSSSRYGKFKIQSSLRCYGFTTIQLSSSPFSILGMKDGKTHFFAICSNEKNLSDLISTIRRYTENCQNSRFIICIKVKSDYSYKELLPGGLVPFGLMPHGIER